MELTKNKHPGNPEISILILGNNLIHPEQLKYILEQHNYKVSNASSDREAGALISKHKPQIIISSMTMPEMDGCQFFKQIKSDKNTKDIATVLFTPLSSRHDVIRGLECGADNFITNPYDERSLISLIRHIITNRGLGKDKRGRQGVEIPLDDKKYFITSDRHQILSLLLSTYEIAIQKNMDLIKSRNELMTLNRLPEERVNDKTAFLARESARVKKIERTLKISEMKFHSVAQLAIEGIVFADNKKIIISCNKALMSIYGYRTDEILGKPFTTLITEQYRNPFLKSLERLQLTGESYTIGDAVELYGLRKNGTVFPLELSISAWKIDSETFYSCIIRNITERKQTDETVRRLAYYDTLTGLPNRILFHDRLSQVTSDERQKYEKFALLIIDIDRFKEINNTLGHQIGDVLLKQVSLRLCDLTKEDGIVASLGGDQFAVLLPNIDPPVAVRTAAMIIKRLEESIVLDKLTLDISASIGISLYPIHGEYADTLIRRAELAMYAAKRTESGWAIYSHKQDKSSPERLTLISELRHAIDQNQLFLLYQPKIELKTGTVIGAEALVRWHHPNLGIILPDQFIALAEHTGFIKQITLWVLKEAIRQSLSWQEKGFKLDIAVNLSAKSFQDHQFQDQIRSLLYVWKLTPGILRFEITESTIMADPERAIGVMMRLNKLGINFSIDDFGTGYSSLNYLKRLPVDEIKIDKSFVINMTTDEDDAVIVRSVIELGHNLGVKITAEGVENQEALDKLAALGCDAAQGYFISYPISQEEITDWMLKKRI